MKKITSLLVLIMALFASTVSAAPAVNSTEVRIWYQLVQAYDGHGGYYVEMVDGTVYTNVGGYKGLDRATRYQWIILVNGKGHASPYHNQLLDGWIETVKVGSGHGFEKPVMYHTLMVSASDPRYKNAINAGPTPVGWVYVVYNVTNFGKG